MGKKAQNDIIFYFIECWEVQKKISSRIFSTNGSKHLVKQNTEVMIHLPGCTAKSSDKTTYSNLMKKLNHKRRMPFQTDWNGRMLVTLQLFTCILRMYVRLHSGSKTRFENLRTVRFSIRFLPKRWSILTIDQRHVNVIPVFSSCHSVLKRMCNKKGMQAVINTCIFAFPHTWKEETESAYEKKAHQGQMASRLLCGSSPFESEHC